MSKAKATTKKTTTPNLDDIYNQIQQERERQQQQTASKQTEFLRPKPGNTYLVRLLPYTADIPKTFVSYDFHGWNSVSTGEYVTTGACPRTWNLPCPVCKAGYAAYEKGIHDSKGELLSKLLLRRTTNLVNIYVIDDSDNPENNGEVKALRYGKQLHGVIDDAVFGEDKTEFGNRVFDLSKTGATLKIVVGHKGDNKKAPPTYEKSKFVNAEGKIDISDPEEIAALHAACFDLSKFVPETAKDEEIERILQQHFYGDSRPLETLPTDTSSVFSNEDSGEEVTDEDIEKLLASVEKD